MATPVTVNYTPVGEDWQVSVVRGENALSGSAPGLIAARDTADQLVEKLTQGENTAVVHLLEGDAVAFSTAYLHARHGGPAGAPTENRTDPSASDTSASEPNASDPDSQDNAAADTTAAEPGGAGADEASPAPTEAVS